MMTSAGPPRARPRRTWDCRGREKTLGSFSICVRRQSMTRRHSLRPGNWLSRWTSAKLAGRLGEDDAVAALTEGACRFQSRRPAAYDQNFLVRFFRRNDFGMPAVSPLLAHGRVLRATDRHEARVAGDADVTADALADVFDAILFDLVWQEGIGNGGPRRRR